MTLRDFGLNNLTMIPTFPTLPILDALLDDYMHNTIKYWFWPYWLLGEMDAINSIQQDLYSATVDGSIYRLFGHG